MNRNCIYPPFFFVFVVVILFNVDCTESGLVETPVGSPESVHDVVDLKPVPKSKQQIKTVAIQNMQVPFKVGRFSS